MYYPGRHRVSYNDGTFSAGDPRSPGLHWTAQHCTLQQQRSQSSLAIVQSNAPPTRLFEFPLTSSPSSVAAAPALPPLPFPTLQSPTEIPPRPGQCKPNLQETKWKSKIDAKFGDSWIRGTILYLPAGAGQNSSSYPLQQNSTNYHSSLSLPLAFSKPSPPTALWDSSGQALPRFAAMSSFLACRPAELKAPTKHKPDGARAPPWLRGVRSIRMHLGCGAGGRAGWRALQHHGKRAVLFSPPDARSTSQRQHQHPSLFC